MSPFKSGSCLCVLLMRSQGVFLRQSSLFINRNLDFYTAAFLRSLKRALKSSYSGIHPSSDPVLQRPADSHGVKHTCQVTRLCKVAYQSVRHVCSCLTGVYVMRGGHVWGFILMMDLLKCYNNKTAFITFYLYSRND